jgi:D-sedoheptulose 7-phosphate isomerase
MSLPTSARASRNDLALRYLEESRAAFDACAADAGFMETLERIADVLAAALAAGGKILLCGNGGSAADAQHIAGELLSRFETERAPLAAIAITVNSSTVTAIGNDYGYEHVFARQALGLGRPGDVLIGLSTSGRSPNVLNALAAVRGKGLITIGFTGAGGGSMEACCDHLLRVPSSRTPVIQQVHMTAGHIVCALVEQRLGMDGGD